MQNPKKSNLLHHKRNRLFGKAKPLHPAVEDYLSNKKIWRFKLFHCEILLRFV